MENRQRYVFIDHQAIPVTEEVYRAYVQPIWKEQKHLARAKRCIVDGVRCEADCSKCSHKRTGNVVSTEILDSMDNSLQDTSADVEQIVEGRMLLEALFEQLEALDPDGQLLCRLILDGMNDTEVAKRMGVCNGTVTYRKKKVFSILREALKDWK